MLRNRRIVALRRLRGLRLGLLLALGCLPSQKQYLIVFCSLAFNNAGVLNYYARKVTVGHLGEL